MVGLCLERLSPPTLPQPFDLEYLQKLEGILSADAMGGVVFSPGFSRC